MLAKCLASGLPRLALALIVAGLVAQLWATPKELLAFGSGYVVFVINYYSLVGIGKGLVQIALAGNVGMRVRFWIALGSMLKFFGLFGVIYLLLVMAQLSGIWLGLGSLFALIILVGSQVATYLQRLTRSSQVMSKPDL